MTPEEIEKSICEEMALHMRTCPDCKANLVKQVKPIARHTLSIFEEEKGSPATAQERATLANTALIMMSMSLAIRRVMSGIMNVDLHIQPDEAGPDIGVGIFSPNVPSVGEA